MIATPTDLIFRKPCVVREKKDTNIRIGQTIAKYREANGETQADLALAVGKERNTISQYEHGRVGIPAQVREIASKRYGIPREDLGLTISPISQSPFDARALDLAIAVMKSDCPAELKDIALEVISEKLRPER